MKGAETALTHCQFILVEVEFNALYEGQPLFSDVDRFLRDRGFVLWRLGNLAHYATETIEIDPHHMLVGSDPGDQHDLAVANGQLFWSDAFYVRREAVPSNDESMTRDAAIAGAALAARQGFHDLALEMVRKSGDAGLLAALRETLGVAFIPAVKEDFPASDFLSPCLTVSASIASDFAHADGHFVYGPYVRLPEGDYEAEFHVSGVDLGDQPLRTPLYFDVAADMQNLHLVELVGEAGRDRLNSGRIAIPFYNGQPNARFEFRISKSGQPFVGTLVFEGVTLRRCAPAV